MTLISLWNQQVSVELSKFCPRCGKETEELHGDKKKLCPDCYTDENNLLYIPSVVELTVCPVCGRMENGGEHLERYSLEEQLGERFAEFNEEEVEMRLQYWEEDDGTTVVRVHASKGRMQDTYDTELRVHEQQCGPCSRFSSGFYKVKIQIRGNRVDSLVETAADTAADSTNKDRNDFLSNIEYNDHGADLYLSTESIAKDVLDTVRSQRDPEVRRSYELAGEQDGQRVYRNVISVQV